MNLLKNIYLKGEEMKKILILSVLVIMSIAVLSANFTAYGSARLGYWYDMEDDDWSQTGESRTNLDYFMQSNSRIGLNFNHGDITARVELSGTGGMRHLWARYNFDTWSLLIGQTETGFNELAQQVYSADRNLLGYGAAWDGRRQMVMLNFDSGLYTAFIKPNDVGAIGDEGQLFDVLLPKINIGYKTNVDNIYLHLSGGINMITYNEDSGELDDTLVSFIGVGTFGYKVDPISVKTQVNYGQNSGNYGISSAVSNRAFINSDNEIENVSTIGFFGDFTFKMADNMNLTAGYGFTSSDSDGWDDSKDASSLYVQMQYRFHRNFRLTPEIGLVDHDDNGSLFYIGSQLRMDF